MLYKKQSYVLFENRSLRALKCFGKSINLVRISTQLIHMKEHVTYNLLNIYQYNLKYLFL